MCPEIAVQTPSSVPDWLNDTFIEDKLRNRYENDGIKVINLDMKCTSGDLGNFASKIYRGSVTFSTPTKDGSKDETSTKSLIIKEAVSDEVALRMFLDFNSYHKEIDIYDIIVPKFNKKLKELGESDLFADVFGTCKQKNILILEDLSVKGYSPRPGALGLNIDETKAVLKRLALYHAICAALQEEQPDIFNDFKHGHVSRGVDGFKNLYIGNLDVVIEIISEWDGFAVYAEKLRRVRGELMERGFKSSDVNPNHFNSYLHGDLWNTNLLIKNGNPTPGKPFENLIFIDFAFSYWSSPAMDLHYFLNGSLSEHLRPDHFDEFVKFYHEHLVDFLERLKFKKHIPTWTEFHAQYQDRMFFAFITSCLVQPVMINNTENIDAQGLVGIDEEGMKLKRCFYKGDKIRANLRKLIPFYDQMGLFD